MVRLCLQALLQESSFSTFLKYTKLSAAQSNILAMLITSVLTFFSHPRAQVGTGEMLCVATMTFLKL